MSRYIRNLQLDGFSEETQDLIRHATVAIVGAGALGSVVAMYLAAAGIGRIRIADFDTIDITNLQRQVFFREDEAGKSKAQTLAERVSGLNSEVEVEVFSSLISRKNMSEFFEGIDIIAECSDNPSTKELCVNYGIEHNVPVVLGGVREYEGQVAVFASGNRYSDIFPNPGCSGYLPCSQGGVFSPLPGIVASLQASEIMKIIGQLPGKLYNELLTFDLRSMDFRKFKF